MLILMNHSRLSTNLLKENQSQWLGHFKNERTLLGSPDRPESCLDILENEAQNPSARQLSQFGQNMQNWLSCLVMDSVSHLLEF